MTIVIISTHVIAMKKFRLTAEGPLYSSSEHGKFHLAGSDSQIESGIKRHYVPTTCGYYVSPNADKNNYFLAVLKTTPVKELCKTCFRGFELKDNPEDY